MNSVVVDQKQRVLVLRLTQQTSDQISGNQVLDEIRSIIERSPVANVLLDLHSVSPINSSLIGQLIMLKKHCDNKKWQLKMSGVSPHNRELLAMVRFEELIDIYDDIPTAIASFSNEPDHSKIPLIDGTASDFIDRAETGDATAQYMMGLCVEAGQGIEQNMAQALEWFRLSAGQGHREAQYKMGLSYAFGVGLAQDIAEAFNWYQMAADNGNADAQYMLGICYQYALNGEQDFGEALYWYQRAASEGHDLAQVMLKELKKGIRNAMIGN